MTRVEFMSQLERLLYEVPLDERVEALTYYNEYFDDAGAEKEQDVIEELETPEKVAELIKANLYNAEQEEEKEGVYTETGYHESLNEPGKQQIQKAGYLERRQYRSKEEQRENEPNFGYQDQYHSNHWYEEKKSGFMDWVRGLNPVVKIVAIFLCILFAVPLFGVVIGMIGTVAGIFLAIAGVCFAFFLSAIIMVIVGMGFIIAGIPNLISSLPNGLVLCGAGLLLLGLGLVFFMVTVFLVSIVLPAIIKSIKKLVKIISKERGVGA